MPRAPSWGRLAFVGRSSSNPSASVGAKRPDGAGPVPVRGAGPPAVEARWIWPGFGGRCYRPAMFLNHFDPSDTSADLLVDRDEDVAWFRSAFESYFDAIEGHTLGPTARRIVCMTGDKGAGKSIVAEKVVQELRKKYSGSTLFVSVDCRSANGARGAVADIASGLLSEIAEFTPIVAAAGTPFPAWLLPLTSVLSAVAHADNASRKTLRQQMTLHRAALKVGGQITQRMLSAEFQLSAEQELRSSDAIETTVNFDVDRLISLTATLFQDIRNAGMRVFLLVDNVDEPSTSTGMMPRARARSPP